jgi:hypothetical protein
VAYINLNFRSTGSGGGRVSRWLQILIFLIFLGVGLFLSRSIVPGLGHTIASGRWPVIPCTILQSYVTDQPKKDRPFGIRVRYAYDYGGKHYVSGTYLLSAERESDYTHAARIVQRYPVGLKTTCRVNPANPHEAILQPSNPIWRGASLAIPLIFVLVGAGGLYCSLRPRRKTLKPLAPVTRRERRAWQMAYGFCGLLLLIGIVSLVVMGRDGVHQIASSHWQAAPAQVIWSTVRQRSRAGYKHRATYDVDIFYGYEVNGQSYKSNRYRILDSASSDLADKQEIVRQYPRGKRITIYVDPADPTQAVIDRSAGLNLLFLLIPLGFTAAGAGGLVWVGRQRRWLAGQPPQATWLPRASRHDRPAAGAARPRSREPVVLRTSQGPMIRFFLYLLVALLFNVPAGFAIFCLLHGSNLGTGPTLFLIPFVLLGLVMIALPVHGFLALFNPRITVSLGQEKLALGDATTVSWSFTGRYDRIQRLTLRLEGREQATYGHGKSTRTDTAVFANTPLVEMTGSEQIRKCRIQLAIPADTMHTFAAANNQVLWVLIVQGDIHHWADVREEFPITVLPLPQESFAPTERP